MFKYGDFEIEREDEHNIALFQWVEIDKYEKKGSGMPVKVPGKVRRRKRLGFFPTFSAAYNGLAGRCAEKCGNLAELREMLSELSLKVWPEKEK